MTQEFESLDCSKECENYQPRLTRRESLKWLGVLSATAIAPNVAGFGESISTDSSSKNGHWPSLEINPIKANGYGKDPNMVVPPQSPWPRILTKSQLGLVAILSDILLPKESGSPSATEVNVPDVIDEWMSAPYKKQQRDRFDFFHLFKWIDDECVLRFNSAFLKCAEQERVTVIEDIAYDTEKTPTVFQRPAKVFSRFRKLVLAAYFCSPQGIKEIGYQGNVPIAGDYPGPTNEAMAHLNHLLKNLGLN